MAGTSTFTLGFLQPNQPSSKQLSSGVYSLSARSNVPFVKIIGKGIDKTITWGEKVEIPKNMLCNVANASYHAGDVFLNNGCDDGRPASITVPVQCVSTNLGGTLYWYPTYPADVRNARRAYYLLGGFAPITGPLNCLVLGQRFDGSHNTFDGIAGNLFGFVGAGYLSIYTTAANTSFGPIPLSAGHVMGDDTRPHALLTAATGFIPVTYTPTPQAYYTIEY